MPQAPSMDCYTQSATGMLDCLFSDLAVVAGGEAVFGLLVGGIIVFGLWWAGGGDIRTPAVVTTLLGGFMIPQLPGSYQSVAAGIMFVGIVAGLLAVATKYVLNPAVR